ncbi:hypothetical protein [Mucilaginibacter auburnensis]|uniref:Uncharacterized protein n=1 Tax=Mucilaginibacter auburnensis TaxID=1457233 RepID=A0A2H9VUD4_9SPHI|nr:hypothetical protein [Mucilaginibacter auburnensis]PJJ84425.1 hypothetical protein CLV57_1437 [Mucilaginibacter auburnensis]
MIKKIRVKESAFKYDPALNQISLFTDLRFVYQSSSFKLDLNQQGEEDLIPIKNAQREKNKLVFSAEYKGEEIDIELIGSTALENLFFDIITDFHQPIRQSSSDLDTIELIFKNGIIKAFYIYKNILQKNKYQLIDSLRLVNEPDGLFLIKQKPFRKIRLAKVHLEIQTIVCESTEFDRYHFTLDVNETVLEIISNIFSVISV